MRSTPNMAPTPSPTLTSAELRLLRQRIEALTDQTGDTRARLLNCLGAAGRRREDALALARGIAETLAKQTLGAIGIKLSDTLDACLRELEKPETMSRGLVPAEIVTMFHKVRTIGNKAAHDSLRIEVADDDVASVLTDVLRIVRWYYGEFARGPRVDPVFRSALPASQSASGIVGEGTSRLAVFMFTDLVDSSRLARQLGDSDYVKYVLEPHNAIFRRLLEQFPGSREIKHTGDGFMATFESATDAAQCALQFHHGLRTATWQRSRPQTRIGVHMGEAIEFTGADGIRNDLAGDAANMTARVMALAEAGQTLLTKAAFDSARQSGRVLPPTAASLQISPADQGEALERTAGTATLCWLVHGSYQFKGADEPFEVCEVGVTGEAPLRSPPESQDVGRTVSANVPGPRPSPGLEVPRREQWFLVEKLGEGGFGEVWLARHQRTKEQRVFKFCFDADRLRSFKRELTFFRLIREHLGDRDDIARLYEVQLDQPPYFLESEYVPNGNVKQWSDRQGGLSSLPLDFRVRLLSQIARAVAAAHSLGIIHKDLKPSNVLVAASEPASGNSTPAFRPRLCDFGIGCLADRTLLEQHEITPGGFTDTLLAGNDSTRTGTRLYQPPESQLGKPATTAGDVYALGVMLYQLVTGDFSRQFGGTGWEEDIPDELLRADIKACTHRDPAQRLPGAADLAGRLENLDRRRIELHSRRRAERAARRLRLLRRALAVAAIALFVVGGLAVFSFVQMQRANSLAKSEQSAKDGAISLAKEKQALLQEKTSALDDLKTAHQDLQRKDDEIHGQLVQAHVREGSLRMDDEYPGAGLLSFARALWQDRGTAREEIHRVRLAALLQRHPRLAQVWTMSSTILRADFSPDGTRLATRSESGEVQLWDVKSGEAVGAALGRSEPIADCWFRGDRRFGALSPYWRQLSEMIAAAPSDPLHLAPWTNVAPRQDRLFTIDKRGNIRAWHCSSGAPAPGSAQLGEVASNAVDISPDGDMVAAPVAIGDRQQVQVWSTVTGEKIGAALEPEADFIAEVKFSPDGNRLAMRDAQATMRIWDLAKGGQVQEITADSSRPPKAIVTAMAFSNNSRSLVTCSADGQARVWDLQKPRSPIRTFHHDGLQGAHFSFDDRYVVTADRWNLNMRAWNIATGDRADKDDLRSLMIDADVFMTPDRRHEVQVSNGIAYLFDRAGSEAMVQRSFVHDGPIDECAVTADGSWLVTHRRPRFLVGRTQLDSGGYRWDLRTGLQFVAPQSEKGLLIDVSGNGASALVLRLPEQGTPIGQVVEIKSWNPVGSAIPMDTGLEAWLSSTAKYAAVMGANSFRVWNIAAGRWEGNELRHSEIVFDCRFSPDERWLLTRSIAQVKLWDLAKLQLPVESFDGIQQASFDDNGSQLVLLGSDQVRILSLPGLEPRLQETTNTAVFAVLNHSGDFLLVGEQDEATVWDIRARKPIGKPFEHHALIRGAFSADGQLVATAGKDGTARIWELRTGNPVTPLLHHEGEIRDVIFHRDGRSFFTAGEDGRVCQWGLAPDTRSIEELVELVELLSGGKVLDDEARAAKNSPRAAWLRLRQRHPEDFRVPEEAEVAWVWQQLRDCYTSANWQRAILYVDEGRELRPRWPVWLGNAGHIYRQLGNLDLSARKYTEFLSDPAIKDNGSTFPIWQELGDLFLQQKQWRDAVRCFEQARKLDKEKYDAYKLGLAYWWTKDWKSARENFELARDREPGNYAPWNALGLTLAETQEWNSAAECFAQARKIKQESQMDGYNEVLCRLATGDVRGYLSVCADLKKRFGGSTDIANAILLCEICQLPPGDRFALEPDTDIAYGLLLANGLRAVRDRANHREGKLPHLHFVYFCQDGRERLTQARDRSQAESLQRSLADLVRQAITDATFDDLVRCSCLLARVSHHLEAQDGARKVLDGIKSAVQKRDLSKDSWNQRLQWQLWIVEAEAELKSEPRFPKGG